METDRTTISEETMTAACARHGLSLRRARDWSRAGGAGALRAAVARDLYAEGYTLAAIGAALARTGEAVRMMLTRRSSGAAVQPDLLIAPASVTPPPEAMPGVLRRRVTWTPAMDEVLREAVRAAEQIEERTAGRLDRSTYWRIVAAKTGFPLVTGSSASRRAARLAEQSAAPAEPPVQPAAPVAEPRDERLDRIERLVRAIAEMLGVSA